nr:ABC transporter substrate-binding protein [uncultured Roseovarius sp.]
MKILSTGLIATAIAVSWAGTSQARDFTVAGWGGAVQEALREIDFTPFAKQQDINVLDDVYTGGWAPFKAMQETGVIPWDVVQIETAELIRGCEEGVLAEIDWDKVGGKEQFIPSAVSDCGVGAIVYAFVTAYNADGIDGEMPSTLQDFWNVDRWPGKRGMRQGPKINLELALMADGVAPGDVYSVLGTPEGVDRAFTKLDEIKPHVQWWTAGAQPPEWLASGDVTMAIAYNGRIANAIQEGQDFGIIWQNALYEIDVWAIPAESPHLDLAHEFIKFASQPENQAAYSNQFAYGPTAKAAFDLLDQDRAEFFPAGENLESALYVGNDEARAFWADYLEELNQRWNTWTGTIQ